MTLRQKVFLTIATVVFLISLVEAGLDYTALRTRSWSNARTERRLERYADDLAASIDLRGQVPIRAGFESNAAPPGRTAYRIMIGDRVLHGERGPFPVGDPGWVTAERDVVGPYRLEAALRRTVLERFLANDLLVDLTDLPVFLALALALSWSLTRNILRPVRELTHAAEQLSRQGRPEPIAVPRGGDELSRMAHSFNAMSESIQGLLERERVFTRYASHELRTPLAALRAQVERASLGLASAEEVVPALARNVRRMEEIIAALLALARSSERDPESTPLLPLVRELVRSFPPEEQARMTVVEGGTALGRVTDARLVQQALQNLLENALRHTSGPVALKLAGENEWVDFRVRDQGPGIPDDVLARPVEPFHGRGGAGGGLGLGLSLVTSIASALKGEFELRNHSTGLEASLSLPVRACEGEGGEIRDRTLSSGRPPGPGKRRSRSGGS